MGCSPGVRHLTDEPPLAAGGLSDQAGPCSNRRLASALQGGAVARRRSLEPRFDVQPREQQTDRTQQLDRVRLNVFAFRNDKYEILKGGSIGPLK